jgi:hypothetical protein
MAQQTNNQEEQWFLRTSGDAVFGPVTSEGLLVWAEQGRVLPGHDVSTDRKHWVSAVSLPFLEMQWYVDDGEGELRGPLNRAAAEVLVKSGKVSDRAQIISADEVDLAEASEEKPKPASDVTASVTQKALTERIQELELQLSERTRAEESDAPSQPLDQLTQERDTLANRVIELETLCETLKRNAEKDVRSAERRAEQLRSQNKKLEEQIEELNARLLMVPPVQETAPAPPSEALRKERDDLRKELDETVKAMQLAEEKKAESDRKCVEMTEHLSRARLETVHWRDEYDRKEKERQEAFSLSGDIERQYSEVLTRVEQMKQDFDRLHLTYEKCVEESKQAQAKALEAEQDLADLLAMANARDAEYMEKIAELERFSAQSPEKIAQFYADQAAIYQLFKSELEALGQEQETERQHLEQLKQMSMNRLDLIQERKHSLTRRLGNSPADMTRLSAREQVSDPASARLRAELDNLRFVHERDIRLAEERESELLAKLRTYETEAIRLKTLAVEGERVSQQAQDLTDQLRQREHELAEERKGRESERQQFQADHQALLSRLEMLEREGQTEAQEPRAAEPKSSKPPSWMRLK